MADEVALLAGGRELGGWKRVSVTRSLETLSDGFELSKSEKELEDPTRRPLRRGSAVSVFLGPDLVIEGFVERHSPAYDPDSHEISVKGWDATRDAVKSSATVTLTLPSTLESLVAQLVAPHGLEVVVDVDTGPRFESFTVRPGETVFEAISRAASFRGVLLKSDGRRTVQITLPGLVTSGALLVKGVNVIGGSAVFDDADRFSEITIEGQRESAWGGDVAGGSIQGTATDEGVTRFLPLVELVTDVPDSQEAIDAAAQRSINLRAAQSSRVSLTVEGWRTKVDVGALWNPGELVSVDDSFLGIRRDLLITAATFSIGPGGRRTQLNLMRPEAFDLRPVKQDPDVPEFWDVT